MYNSKLLTLFKNKTYYPINVSGDNVPLLAYGTKQLTKDATNCMRVRRTIGGSEKDIGFDSKGNIDESALIDFGGYNYIQYSEDFSNSAWDKTSFVVDVASNAVAAPDGTVTADLITDNLTTGNSIIFQSADIVASTESRTFNCSIYLKEGTAQQTTLNCFIPGNAAKNAIVNWSDATTNVGTLEDVGNGWYRLNYDIAVAASSTVIRFRVWPENKSFPARTGGVYVWGAQITEGSGVKDYQKRTNNHAINLTFAKWYDQVNSNDATQSTASAQPKIYDSATGVVRDDGGNAAIEFDDNGQNLLVSSAFGKTNYSCYFLLQPSDTVFIFGSGDDGGKRSYTADSTSTSTSIFANYGTPSLYTNNIEQSPTNQTDIYNTLKDNLRIVNHHNASTSTWTQFNLGDYTGGSLARFKGYCTTYIAHSDIQSQDQRQQLTLALNKLFKVF